MKRLNRKTASQLVIMLMAFVAFAMGAPAQVFAAQPQNEVNFAYRCSIYIVKRGDTLIKIANWNGVTVRNLMDVNRLRTTRILIGQRMCIPTYYFPGLPPPPAGLWYGQYWNNTSESGGPALVRSDPAIDFNWGYGSPDAYRVFSSYFSAQWTRSLWFVGGTYRFALNADDGIRLAIDGTVVFDRLSYVGIQSNQLDVPIAPGAHRLTVDYVQQAGLASVRVTFYRLAPPPCFFGYWGCPPVPPPCSYGCTPQNGSWNVEFYQGTDTIAGPFIVQVPGFANVINFNWGSGAPYPGVPATQWSARFTNYQYFAQAKYHFVATSDNGVLVWVDKVLVINNWSASPAQSASGDITISSPGQHLVTIAYRHQSGNAALQVTYQQQ